MNIPAELYIGGDGLARGYHQRPELTAERFVPDPFVSIPGRRLYRTGDLARYRADGTVEYLGRLDHQVKIRGFRIELGEIESVLATHPQIEQVVVMSHETAPGDQRLIAYLGSNSVEKIDSAELRSWLAERLPQHMLPSAFVFVDTFPLTPNGKVDRQALLEMGTGSRSTSSSTVPPRPGLESVVAQVWRETLQLDYVAANETFFNLGGNSLLGIRLLANLEKVVGRRLPVSVLFQGQTVQAMATALGDDFSNVSFQAVPLQEASGRPPLFIVPGVDGDVVGYDKLARALGGDQPVYGLRSVGLDAEAEPLDKMEEIAARFIEEIRRIQPHGPYTLSGLCIGGVVAYEMAQQLQAQGEAIERLIMIGSWPPATIIRPVPTSHFMQQLIFLGQGVARHIRGFLEQPSGQRFAYLKEKAAIIPEIWSQRDVYRGDSKTMYRDLVVRANQHAASRYRVVPYRGAVTLIITDGYPIKSEQDPRLYWKSVAQDNKTIMIPAEDSGALLKPPFLRSLAAVLVDELHERDKVQTTQTSVS